MDHKRLVRSCCRTERGFTLAELILVCAVIGILSVMAVPAFLSYYQAATLKAGAEQVVALLNQAREVAIKTNSDVCVNWNSSTQRMIYMVEGPPPTAVACSQVWVGVGTDAAGNISLPTGVTMTASANPVTFNYIGAVSTTPAPTYTVTNPKTGGSLTVSVATSGRVKVQ